MTTETFVRRTRIEAEAEAVFRWHARPGALQRLTPPWTRVDVLQQSGGIENGARVVLALRLGPRRVRWVAEHFDYVAGRQFRDRQVEGPFAHWEHTHGFEPDGPSACYLEDRIAYALPMGSVGALLGGPLVRQTLERTFAYRHRTTADDLAAHAAYRGPALHVVVSGSSGLVGSALVPFLTTGGHRVTRLVRAADSRTDAVRWDPTAGTIDAAGLEGADAVVHLAGENIAGARWTDATKARMLGSRVHGTKLLCETLARLQRPPKTLISASGVGYYGDRGAAELTEASEPGSGFLATVSRQWEAATAPAADRGIRVVCVRIGVVLTPAGGALAQMLIPFRLGLGGRIGPGTQYISWIALDDLLGVILQALTSASLDGAVNAVAPTPITNSEFTRVLGRVLRRPTLFSVPAAAIRVAFGEMADEMLLASTRATPARLLESGYHFRHPQLEGALRHTLGRA
jgi:uncharacterized protein